MITKKELKVLESILIPLASSGVIGEELLIFIKTAVNQKIENNTSEESPDTLLTRRETADFLRCSLRNVDRLLAEDILPCVRFGLRSVRIRKSDVLAMLVEVVS